MKGLMIGLVLVAIGVVSLGFYRGWFTLSSNKDAEKSNVTLTVDQEKFKEDKGAVVEKVTDVGDQVKDAVGSEQKTVEGTLVSVTDQEVTMTDSAGVEQHHPLATDVKITCDAQACQAMDLRPGMRIRLTTKIAPPHSAIRIEAIDKNVDFEKAG
jgi:hypothetical protein